MKNLFLAIAVVLAFTIAAPAQQSLNDRLEALERQTKQLNDLSTKVDAIEKKVDALSAKIDMLTQVGAPAAPPKPTAQRPMCPGCNCGCADTGVCTCATMRSAVPRAMTTDQARTLSTTWTYSTDGVTWYPYSGATVQSYGDVGACANGSCSTGGGRGLFGRRR